MEEIVKKIKLENGRLLCVYKDTGYTVSDYEMYSYALYDIDLQVIRRERGFSSEIQAETAGTIVNAIERKKDAATK